MQFLKSLFCLQGFDNRIRFFAISSAIYVVFIMLSSAFLGDFYISTILAILFSVVLALTSLRRLHDAKLNKNWLFAPSLTFTVVALIIIFTEQSSSYYLLIIPALCSLLLLTYLSVNPKNFILGYYGPVDMKEYLPESHQSKQAKFRIEPSLAGESAINLNNDVPPSLQKHEAETLNYSQNINSNNKQSDNTQSDLGETIRLTLLSNKKAQVAIAAIIAIICISVTVSWLISYFDGTDNNTNDSTLVQKNAVSTLPISREHPLTMPDNYTLYLSEHQGITINWQADEVSEGLLWSQLTAQGDTSCQQISFNKGESIRTLSVGVGTSAGTNTDYYASFSPLDSKELIQALAFRGSFSLCGYDFSLKGSQAALGTNERYAKWVDY